MTLDTVLVAVRQRDHDNIDSLASAVRDVAEPAEASVVLAHVFEDGRFEETVANLDYQSPADADVDEVTGRLNSVRNLKSTLSDAGLEVSVTGRRGNPGSEIVDVAEDRDVDLVFVGGRKRSPAGKAVFGSTAQEILLESPVPVTFVRLD